MPSIISRRERLKGGAKAAAAIGPPEETAERIRFLDVSGNRALRLNVSATIYYRTYMP